MAADPGSLAWLSTQALPSSSTAATWVKALGWTGQVLFFGRVLMQWLASERARRPVAPKIFWWLSAGGAVFMSAYSILRGEMVMLPAYVVTLGIYLRNLWLANHPAESGKNSSLLLVMAVGLLLAVGPYAFGLLDSHDRPGPEVRWLALAILGQALWIGRFLLQWRHAERRGASEFPAAFWWLTIVGSTVLLAYSLHRGDHVFIFGFLTSWIAPVRNLMLHHRHAKASL